jgi:hypothetical protein
VGRYEQIFHCFGTPEHSNEKRKLLALTVRAECVRPQIGANISAATEQASTSAIGVPNDAVNHSLTRANTVSAENKEARKKASASPTDCTSPLDGIKAPSDAVRDFLLPFEERLLRQLRHQAPLPLTPAPHQADVDLTKCRVPGSQPIFKPNYTAITLQQYEIGHTYEIVFTLRNIDKVKTLHV